MGRPKHPDLTILQDSPTQFDAPLFRALESQDLNLLVGYRAAAQNLDPELGRVPDFGNMLAGYSWHLFDPHDPLAFARGHVIVSGWSSAWSWRALLRARRASAVHTVGLRFDSERTRDSHDLVRRRLALTRVRLALRLADVWHPVGSSSAAFAASVSRECRTVVTIPYAIDAEPFLRAKAGSRPQDPRVLCVAKLIEREGVADVVRAVARVPGLSLTVVGDGDDRQRLERLACELGVDATFAGYVRYEELPRWYSHANIFVHAARVEPWGVSVQEAMAAGLAVIASNEVGAANELLADAEAPIRFPAGDVGSLSECLIAMADRSVRERVIRENETWASRLTPEKTARELADFVAGWHDSRSGS